MYGELVVGTSALSRCLFKLSNFMRLFSLMTYGWSLSHRPVLLASGTFSFSQCFIVTVSRLKSLLSISMVVFGGVHVTLIVVRVLPTLKVIGRVKASFFVIVFPDISAVTLTSCHTLLVTTLC